MSQLILPGDAGPGDVLAGKKFCAGTVYNGQGTMPNNGAVSGTVASNGGTKTIPAGYTTGGTVTATTDSNLVAGNIRSGISIFGVAGSYSAGTINPTGNATPTQVLSGTTFSSATYPNGSTGTMVNNGAVTLTPGPSNVAIPAGYHNGSGIVSAVSVPAGNVLSGTTIAGTSGTMANNGAVVMTPGTANQAIATGYHNGSGYVKGDTNLVTGNIKAGANIFGVAGKSSVVDTSDANAIASQILSGLYAYVNGVKLTGTIPSKTAQTYTPGTSAQTISAGQYLSGAQTISGDANLIAANILSGVSIFGVAGSYPTNPSSSSQGWATPGTYSWTVPLGVTRVLFGIFGAGGGGGGSGTSGGYGGGGGGAYTGGFASVVPGSTVTVVVGTGGPGGVGNSAGTAGGDSSFGSYVAKGGGGGTLGSYGAGGASQGHASPYICCGAGGTGGGSYGQGAGGGGGGSAANGGNGSNGGAGTSTTGGSSGSAGNGLYSMPPGANGGAGGIGGSGGSTTTVGGNGVSPGGGGGAGGGGTGGYKNGGAGAQGAVYVAW